eukprot:XP_763335.1 hypothetical protein [Theileria parva strain Muguga]
MNCRLVKLSKFLRSYGKVIGKHKYQPILSVETQLYSSLNQKLCYGGYFVEDLVLKKDFLEVFYLLLNSQLPNPSQLTQFTHKINQGFGSFNSISPSETLGNVIECLLYNFTRLRGQEEDFEYVFGQCLAILTQYNSLKIDPDTNNPVEHLTNQLLNLTNMEERVKKVLNAMFILYMDHGLTSNNTHILTQLHIFTTVVIVEECVCRREGVCILR